MTKLNFEAAKQQVAKTHGYQSWDVMIESLVFFQSVKELNEAVTELCEIKQQSASIPEPTEEEIEESAFNWLAEGKTMNVAVIWGSAINWYKAKIGRS